MMRAFSIVACTALALIAGACSVQEVDSPEYSCPGGMELEFVGQFGEVDTKSELQSDNSIYWSRYDAIKVYYGASNGSRFTAVNEEDHFAKATFKGYLEAFTGLNESGDYNYFWGVYPSNAAMGCDGDAVVVNLPEIQVAKAGSFADNTNVTIAKSPGLALSFFNTCSWLRFSVERDDIHTVIFSGNDEEDVAGIYLESFGENERPTPPEVMNGAKTVTLKTFDGQCLIPGQYYFITLLPQTFEQGFSITFVTDTEHGTVEYPNSFEFKMSEYKTTTKWDQYAVFKPNSVIQYTSTDGEAVYPDEGPDDFDAPILSNVYENGQGTITFCGELSIIGDRSFFGRSTLQSITIPDTVKSIEDAAFYGTGLTSIVIPASVESIAYRAFSYCSSLESIKVDSANPNYDSRSSCNAIIEKDSKTVIAGCKNTSLPSNGILKIGRYAFMGLKDLTTIRIPATVTFVGENAFFDCTALETVTFLQDTPPDGDEGVFSQCYNLTKIKVPRNSVNAYKAKEPWSAYSSIIDWK